MVCRNRIFRPEVADDFISYYDMEAVGANIGVDSSIVRYSFKSLLFRRRTATIRLSTNAIAISQFLMPSNACCLKSHTLLTLRIWIIRCIRYLRLTCRFKARPTNLSCFIRPPMLLHRRPILIAVCRLSVCLPRCVLWPSGTR